MITRISNQATDIQGRLGAFVAAHGAVAFFDPPTDGAFRGIVRAIQYLVSSGVFPSTIKSEARPKVPAIQKEIAETISNASGSVGMRNAIGDLG